MMEGKLQKKAKSKSFKTTWQSEKMTHSKDSILLDDLLEIVEEAKKTFPFCCEPNHYVSKNPTTCPCNEWFEKYFGRE